MLQLTTQEGFLFLQTNLAQYSLLNYLISTCNTQKGNNLKHIIFRFDQNLIARKLFHSLHLMWM